MESLQQSSLATLAGENFAELASLASDSSDEVASKVSSVVTCPGPEPWQHDSVQSMTRLLHLPSQSV